jgi:hypothetical protein
VASGPSSSGNCQCRAAGGSKDGAWTQVAPRPASRTALSAYPQQTLAGLTDNAWRQFLIDSSGLDGFNGSTGDALLRGPYQAAIEFDTDAVQQLVRDWILQHKRRWPC